MRKRRGFAVMENSIDCVASFQNSPDRDFGTKCNKLNQNLCKKGAAYMQILLMICASFAFAFLMGDVRADVTGANAVPDLIAPPPLAGTKLTGSLGSTPTSLPVAGGSPSIPAVTQVPPGGEFTFKGFFGKLATGNAKFGVTGTAGSVVGALAQGVFWGGVLYGAVKLLAPMLGADEATTDALSKAVLAGGIGGGIIKATLVGVSPTNPGFFPGLTAGQTGFIAGLAITAIVFIALYKDQKKQMVQFQCLPWEPPLGGASCEKCNNDPFRPCSEYRCKSLGQACELLNAGTGKEQCTWISKGDVKSPTITPWAEALRPIDARYITDTSIRPPALGVKVFTASAEGCLPAFTPLQFGIITNEPSQCKLDYNHTAKFDEMQFYFGGDNYYAYNHTQQMRLPGPDALAAAGAPVLKNDGTFSLYVRCRDGNGNVNEDEYSVNYCVQQGPDTTPPIVEQTSIVSGSSVRYNVDRVPIELYVNEPAECKWSTQSKAYEDMENSMHCATDVTDINELLTYTCSGNLTGVKNQETNNYYFRCLDKPDKPLSERNPMRQSYPFSIKGSQPLVIDSISPNGTISGSTSTVRVSIDVQTSNGAEEGKALCSFSPTGQANSYVPMFATNNFQHKQELALTNGTYTTYIRCADAGGNSADTVTSFTIKVDTESPKVTRVYHDQALKVVTDEDAQCKYSLASCNFALDDGLSMQYLNVETKNVHFADWNPSATYYIRCSDSYGNEPTPSTCSVVARPTDIERKI